jgi:hypothetical protein
LWVAPSGGRDRPDPKTNEWVPVRLFSLKLAFLASLFDRSATRFRLHCRSSIRQYWVILCRPHSILLQWIA